MKRNSLIILQLLVVSVLLSCESKKKEFTLIGKWQLEERISGNGGGKTYHEEISDGRTFEFKENGDVVNEVGQIGKYEVEKDDSFHFFLHVSFPKLENEYFSFYPDEKDSEKMILNPVDAEHQLLCDCGCAEIYLKD